MKNPDSIIIKERYDKILNNIKSAAEKSNRNPDDIKVIAVSKTHPVDIITESMSAGINIFGENYVQELKEKIDFFENNNFKHPEWHYIGHLQRNKVKYIAPYVSMIHGVDSVRLANQINKEAAKIDKKIDVLLQVNTSGEDSKFGCSPEKVFEFAEHSLNLERIRVKGLMTIGSFTYDGIVNKKEFSLLRELLNKINDNFNTDLTELSMGMTNDYELAVEEGSTMVRVGTAIFGERDYS